MAEFAMVSCMMIFALTLTIAIECGVIFAAHKDWKLTYWVLLCNLITNPILNAVMLVLYQITTNVNIIILLFLEISVVVCEGCILKYISGWKISKTMKISAIINILSFVFGLVLLCGFNL